AVNSANTLAAFVEGHDLTIRELPTLKKRSSIRLETFANRPAFSLNGKWVACGGDGCLEIVRVGDMVHLRTVQTESHLQFMLFRPDNVLLTTSTTMFE